jgi:hypothetical protein
MEQQWSNNGADFADATLAASIRNYHALQLLSAVVCQKMPLSALSAYEFYALPVSWGTKQIGNGSPR